MTIILVILAYMAVLMLAVYLIIGQLPTTHSSVANDAARGISWHGA